MLLFDVCKALMVTKVAHDEMVGMGIYIHAAMGQVVYMVGGDAEFQRQFDVQEFM